MPEEQPKSRLAGLWRRLFGRPADNERKEICHHCGKPTSLDARRCQHCGKPVVPRSRWDKL